MNWSGSDRKSTRLNSSHEWISYAVFCLKNKKDVSRCPDWSSLDVSCAPSDGPVAFCGDLSPASLLGAYRRGILPLPVFFNYTATTEIYTLSLHDALPI